MKFYPGRNDGHLIQHADDQINNGAPIAGEPHESPMVAIGNAIESYNGAKTCEVWMDSEEDSPPPSSGVLLYSERPVEQVKFVTWDPVQPALVHLIFRLRAKEGSANFVDIHQWVRVAQHTQLSFEACA